MAQLDYFASFADAGRRQCTLKVNVSAPNCVTHAAGLYTLPLAIKAKMYLTLASKSKRN